MLQIPYEEDLGDTLQMDNVVDWLQFGAPYVSARATTRAARS